MPAIDIAISTADRTDSYIKHTNCTCHTQISKTSMQLPNLETFWTDVNQ